MNLLLRLMTTIFSITRNPDPDSYADRFPKGIFR
jgi:hypothetical protein